MQSPNGFNSAPWWQIEDESERVNAVVGAVRQIQAQTQDSNFGNDGKEAAVKYMRLYAGREYLKYLPIGYAAPYGRVSSVSAWDDNRIRLNICQSIIDTLTAKIGKNRPKPTYLTDSGKWEDRVAAKDLDAWTEGAFYQAGVYENGPLIFRDAAIFGTGFEHVYSDEGKICIERVFPSEILVDPVDAKDGNPRVLYRIKSIDQYVLAEHFPRYREQIELSQGIFTAAGMRKTNDVKQVQVVEAWHLPSSKKAKDGKHIICIDGQQLNTGDDAWTRSEFPFAIFRWSRPLLGFMGEGACERLLSIQLEINTLLQKIQESFRLLAKPTVYVEEGSKVVKQHLTSQIANIVMYRGTAPVIASQQTVHPEVFRHLNWLVERAYFQEGVSQMSAAGQKPLGIDSGRGMRVLSDVETDRFSTLSRDWETFHMDVARLMIAEAKECIEKGIELDGVVMTRNRREPRKIDFQDIQISEDDYVMQVFPISSLSSSPAARMEDVQDMMSVGLIDPQYGRRLLDFPDLDLENSIDFAPLDFIDWTASNILTKGEYQEPKPYQNLKLTIVRVQKIIQRERVNGAPDDRIELLEQYLEETMQMDREADAAALEQQAAMQQQAMAAQQMTAPPGTGGPPEGAMVQ